MVTCTLGDLAPAVSINCSGPRCHNIHYLTYKLLQYSTVKFVNGKLGSKCKMTTAILDATVMGSNPSEL